jgi:general transcription factor 3C polypeptide 3 (transcription factor C subunit 4)
LADLHPIVLATKKYRFGADALRTAFDWHTETFFGPNDTASPENNTMTLENVINLADLLLQLDELEEAVVVIRRGQRWLQGRNNERQWDVQEDDREFDPEGLVREGEGGEEEEGVAIHPLDVNLRQRLALVRLRLGHDIEANVSCFIRWTDPGS